MQNLENGVAKFDQKVFEDLLRKLATTYRYFNNNEAPYEVVVPFVVEVDGVRIRYEQPKVPVVTSAKKKKRRVMAHASVS